MTTKGKGRAGSNTDSPAAPEAKDMLTGLAIIFHFFEEETGSACRTKSYKLRRFAHLGYDFSKRGPTLEEQRVGPRWDKPG